MSEPLYTMPEVAREVGLEYRTLHTWLQRGLLTPTRMTNGTGYPTLFSAQDVRRVAMLASLRRAGCGMEILEIAAKAPIVRGRVKLEMGDVSVVVSCAR